MAELPLLISGGAGKTGARVNAGAVRNIPDYARRTAAGRA
jgi:hypothetical protein